MTYFQDVYLRFYLCIGSEESWFLWAGFVAVIIFIALVIQGSENPYKKRILYLAIVFIISTFVLRVALWVLLPSPEYLEIIK